MDYDLSYPSAANLVVVDISDSQIDGIAKLFFGRSEVSLGADWALTATDTDDDVEGHGDYSGHERT